MHDTAAGGHPLHVAGAERAAVAEAVAVLDRAREHVGDGLDAAMRMPRKAGTVILRPLVAKIVEQQERIEFVGIAEAECALEFDTGAFDRRLRLDDLLDGANGHERFPDAGGGRVSPILGADATDSRDRSIRKCACPRLFRRRSAYS